MSAWVSFFVRDCWHDLGGSEGGIVYALGVVGAVWVFFVTVFLDAFGVLLPTARVCGADKFEFLASGLEEGVWPPVAVPFSEYGVVGFVPAFWIRVREAVSWYSVTRESGVHGVQTFVGFDRAFLEFLLRATQARGECLICNFDSAGCVMGFACIQALHFFRNWGLVFARSDTLPVIRSAFSKQALTGRSAIISITGVTTFALIGGSPAILSTTSHSITKLTVSSQSIHKESSNLPLFV